MFEPSTASLVDNHFSLAPDIPVLVKVTVGDVDDVVPDPLVFDRRVMTVRDPRDVVVSALLSRPFNPQVLRRPRSDDRLLDTFVAGVADKESHPDSCSIRELFKLAARLDYGRPPFRAMQDEFRAQQALLERCPFQVVRYEQFVANDLADLSSYLGVPVENLAAAGAGSLCDHRPRPSYPGEFRQWFQPDDLAYFNDMFGDYVTAMGYELDVELAAHPAIDPEASSEHVRRRYYERRDAIGTQATRGTTSPAPDVDSDELRDRLTRAGENGDATACLRLAEMALRRPAREPDPRNALRWARAAAQFGDPAAMRLTIQLLQDQAGADPRLHRELRRWQTVLQSRSSVRSRQDIRRIAALEAEVRSLRTSVRWRLGSHLVSTARNPLRHGPKAARTIVAMWRRHRKSKRGR